MQRFVNDKVLAEELGTIAKDCEGFAKRPIDEGKLEKMEHRMREMQL